MIMNSLVLIIVVGTLVTLIQSLILEVPNTEAEVSGSKTITLYTVKRSWKEAQAICMSKGGYLINLETSEKRRIFQEFKDNTFSSDYDKPWVGLYWTDQQKLHWDGSACPGPEAQDVDAYTYKADGEKNFKNAERCYRDNDGLELRDCGGNNMFVCETFSADGCPYVKRNIPMSLQINADVPQLDDCVNECNSKTGCFLTGSLLTYCILMYAVDYANNTVAVKNCASGSSIDRSTINGITSDTSNPDCSINPTTTTPTIEADACDDTTVTETSTETTSITSTITSTDTYTQTDISTETSTESFTETSTEVITETSTETQTDTVTETSTITNSAATTTVYEVSSIVISEVSTAVITLTESPSCDITCSSSEMVESSTECSTFSTVYVPYSSSLSPSYTKSDTVTVRSNPVTTSSTFGGFMAADGTLRTQVCRNIIYVTPDPAQTQAAVKSIVNELTVEKGNLTAVVIKKISAEDQRPSSTVMGYAGIVFLIIPIILMIIVDVPTYYMAAQAAVKFCKKNNH